MEFLTEDLPQEMTGEERRVQYRYYWTRSELGKPADFQFFGEAPGKIDTVVGTPTVDGTYVIVEFNSEFVGKVRQLAVPYVGEPLQLLSKRWLANDFVPRPRERDIEEWIECRRSKCRTAADRFFLALDLDSNLSILPEGISRPEDERRCHIKSLQKYLLKRVEHRALNLDEELSPATDYIEQIDATCQGLEVLLMHEFEGEMELAREAFEQFAAGWLRQECEVDDMKTVAADADSAFVFLFAELVLAVKDIVDAGRPWHQRFDFWRPFLPYFVRMQDIYLSRFEGHRRRCFKYYGKAQPLDQTTSPRLSCTARMTNDLAALQEAMYCNLQRTVDPRRRRDCFKNLW